MKIETQPLEDHQIKLVVEVEQEPFEEAKQRAARKLAKRVKIPGFRPGKAPYAVIVRHVGESTIVEEAIEILVNDVYPEAIKQAEIEPYSLGTLENIPNLDPPTFEFIVPLKATVELGDYAAIRMDYKLDEVSQDDIDQVVNNLLDRQALVEPVDRPAQVGDLVRIHLHGERKEPKEGENPTVVQDREYPVVIDAEDSEDDSEWPYQGFSHQLIGLSAGDTKELDYHFPEESPYDNLRNTTVSFQVNLNQVNSRTVPELNDEFASSIGEYSNLEELYAAIRGDLQRQNEQAYNEEYDDKLLDEVISISTIKYPPQMLDQEIQVVIDRLKDNLAMQNLDIDLYLKSRQMDMDALKEEVKPVAETRLNKSLTLLEVAEAEKIQVNPDELQTETNRTLDELSYYMEEKDFRKMLQTNDARTNLVSNVMMEMIIDHARARLRDIARGIIILQDEETPESEPDSEAPIPQPEDATENDEDLADGELVNQEEIELPAEASQEQDI